MLCKQLAGNQAIGIGQCWTLGQASHRLWDWPVEDENEGVVLVTWRAIRANLGQER
jgi:hypothetical protein